MINEQKNQISSSKSICLFENIRSSLFESEVARWMVCSQTWKEVGNDEFTLVLYYVDLQYLHSLWVAP